MSKNLRHEFALYWPQLSVQLEQYPEHALFQLDDTELVHRIVNILRLKQEDPLIFFDTNVHVHAELGKISKKSCMVQINAVEDNTQLVPSITFGLPLLKKEAFDRALYSLVECGASAIQLLTTHKVHRPDWSVKEADRAERVVIAAAEQSKQFAIPAVNAPVSLETFVTSQSLNFDVKIFFDPHGQRLSTVFHNGEITQNSKIFLLIGPEGDLTNEEKELLKKAGFLFIALTPTVLRSQQAAALGLGVFRALT